jgi:hypothetical protein
MPLTEGIRRNVFTVLHTHEYSKIISSEKDIRLFVMIPPVVYRSSTNDMVHECVGVSLFSDN